MKKVLLSLFCSLMIGVTCFAPLTVSANDEYVNTTVGYYNDVSYSIVENVDVQMGDAGAFTKLLTYNGDVGTFNIGIPFGFVNNDYYDIYMTFIVDNIDLSNAAYNNQFNLRYSNMSVGSFSNVNVSFDKNVISVIVKNQNYVKASSFNAYGYQFSISNMPLIDSSKSGNIYLKNIEVWHAETPEKLAKLQEDPMKDFLNNTNSIFTECMNWIDSLITIIVETPILLLTTGFLCLGAAVALFGRFISKD